MEKVKLLLFVVFIVFGIVQIEAQGEFACGDNTWEPYEGNCIKLVDFAEVTITEATRACDQIAPGESSQVLTIKSQAEQDFLTSLVFGTNQLVGGIWLLATRQGATNQFQWGDGSPLSYSNWASGAPSSDALNGCLEMSSSSENDERDGIWKDVSCAKLNRVVCQKPLELSLSELQEIVMENKAQLQRIQENPGLLLPVGFIYVQLPRQPAPIEIWQGVNWTDVTSNYAGEFFRAEGGNSLAFGNVQPASSPRLTDVDMEDPGVRFNTTVVPGKWSDVVFTGHLWENATDPNHMGIRFLVSDEEVRPINTAVRIWQRTE